MTPTWLLIVAVTAVAVSGPLVYSRSFAPAVCKTVWIPDCGKGLPVTIDNVIVEGCCNGQAPCMVPRGVNILFSYTFTIGDQGYTYLNQSACGEVGTICVPFPGENFGAMCDCPGCTLEKSCPFVAKEMNNISVKVDLSKTLPPSFETEAKWTIKDPKGSTVGCFEVPVETK